MDSILKLVNIVKEYPGVLALNRMNLDVRPGEVHALMGENGAGKSTLIKVVSGAIRPNAGKIIFDNQEYEYMTPQISKKLGIGVVYQEFNLVPELSVAENIFLGQKLTSGFCINRKMMNTKAQKLMDGFGIKIDVKSTVKNLSVAYQQLVEITKTISSDDVKVLILDEPTAPLTNREITVLFEIINKLKEQGIAIIYISHRMEEIFQIADRITIMRDGEFVATKAIKETNNEELIRLMVGRELNDQFPVCEKAIGETVLSVQDLCTEKLLQHVSFELHKGEILGLAGLVGAGRTETARAIYGADPYTGSIRIHGQEVQIKAPKDAIGKGISLIPEDRKKQGVLLDMSIRNNISFVTIRSISKFGFVDRKKDRNISEDYIKKLRIKTPSMEQLAKNLSGGNQQKVVMAKALASNSDIMIFDEPTRGIDVGAKHEIYELMNSLAQQGMAIIMISSEMPEILGMSDRIIVMHEGEVTGELSKEEATQEKILALASNIKADH